MPFLNIATFMDFGSRNCKNALRLKICECENTALADFFIKSVKSSYEMTDNRDNGDGVSTVWMETGFDVEQGGYNMRLYANHAPISHADKRPHANNRNFRNTSPEKGPGENALAKQIQNSAEPPPQETFFYEWEQENEAFHFFAWEDEVNSSALAPHSDAQAGGQSALEDNSGNLTRRLVSARNTFVLHTIIGDAFKDLGELRLALAMSDGEDADTIRQIIRRLERVIRRGNRKITELNREAALERKQDRALERDEQQRAEKIENELRRRIIRRRNREQGYLDELMREQINGAKADAKEILDAVTEAKIAAKARAIVAAQSSAASSGGASSSGGLAAPALAGAAGGAEGGASLEAEMSGVDVLV